MAEQKLTVLVGVDVDSGAAHIRIGGNVTHSNLGTVYRVARRANTMTRGAGVVLDLRRASVGVVPLKELHLARRAGELPPAAGSPAVPCRLDILNPAAV